jgi:transcription antitermination factor NusG
MTLYAFYTRREFEAQAEAEALGLTCYVPRRVDLIRQGNRRRPDAVVRPYLPGYVFIDTDNHGWQALKGSKHLRSWIGIGGGNARQVMQFIDRVEADYQARMAQIEAGQRVDEYEPGDLLQIIAGPFAGQLARFQRVAEGAGMFPELIAEGDLFGQAVTIRLDPLAARKAVA